MVPKSDELDLLPNLLSRGEGTPQGPSQGTGVGAVRLESSL